MMHKDNIPENGLGLDVRMIALFEELLCEKVKGRGRLDREYVIGAVQASAGLDVGVFLATSPDHVVQFLKGSYGMSDVAVELLADLFFNVKECFDSDVKLRLTERIEAIYSYVDNQ